MTDTQTAGEAPVDGASFFQNMLNTEAGAPTEPSDKPASDTDDSPVDDDDDGEEVTTTDTGPDDTSEQVDDGEEVDDTDNAKVEGEDAYDMSQAIKIKLPDSGEEAEVTLSELIKGYTRQADYTKKTQALAEQQKALESQVSAKRQISEREARNQVELISIGQRYQNAISEFTQEQWQELRITNPAEYSARIADLMQMERQIDAKKAERQQIISEDQRLATEAALKAREEGEKKLTSRIPEWKDPAKREALQTRIGEYLTGFGYSTHELNSISDPRAVEVAFKAMRYDEMMTGKKSLAAKKLASAPKMLKPGAAKDKSEKTADVRRSVMDRVRKTGSAVEYFNQFG